MDPAPLDEEESFSLTRGGPFYRLLVRLRLRTPDSWVRCFGLGSLVWMTLVLATVVAMLLGLPFDPMLRDMSVHVRLLFTLPMMLYSEGLLEDTCRAAVGSFRRGGYCEHAALDAILARAERVRDNGWAEVALLALAVLGGQLVLWEVFGPTGFIHADESVGFWSLPRVWYALVALPLVQFVMFRWMWRWLIWVSVLGRLARLPLTPLTTHADLAGGLSCLARPVTGFSGFVLAVGSILSGAWATRLYHKDVELEALLPGLLTFLLASLAGGLGPLLLFCGHLFRARRRDLTQFGDFVREYALRFRDKWIENRPSSVDPLGTSDIQSLSDIGGSFRVIAQTTVFAFSTRTTFTLLFAGTLPMMPLLMTVLTVDEIVKKIFSTVLGGLPL